MHDPHYYRDQAERARRLLRGTLNAQVISVLRQVAQDYDDIAEDLERGAIQIRHAELMPQNQHSTRKRIGD